MQVNQIITGDCLEVMKAWPDNSVDAIVTDIPYGIGFMGKEWDTFKKDYLQKHRVADRKRKPRTDGRTVAAWNDGADAGTYDHSRNAEYQEWCRIWSKEALRIAKPGAFLMCFGGTRTYHRVTCGLEDAGWQIRDCMMWLYGSGFPKSHNISKAIDKAKGVERKQLVEKKQDIFGEYNEKQESSNKINFENLGQAGYKENWNITNNNTDLAKLWDGYGTALKPAWEPIIVAMKPLDGTFAQNAEKHGVAGLNIDGGRIGFSNKAEKQKHSQEWNRKWETDWLKHRHDQSPNYPGWKQREEKGKDLQGRWPANVILDEDAASMLDEQSGVSGNKLNIRQYSKSDLSGDGGLGNKGEGIRTFGDSGGASRFFYCAKASRSERNVGLEGMEEKRPDDRTDISKGIWVEKGTAKQTNHHPTVKPLKLMEYLCTLLKPPSEHPILLDPFCGSGTTLMAAYNTGWDYVGIDKEAEYVEIAKRRVAWCKKQNQNQQPLFPA
ncbi:hypothetical protein LCGC14_1281930 [marine sediment metagenome]|uniref:DNA methylase N-4/N-6 domain-containing protein n=1 Tax=marine sediment metagenome TaxID=412755 RepID=A0A0F9KUZ4_9ZZZZ